MKVIKIILRIGILVFLIYCLYSAYPYPNAYFSDKDNWINKDGSSNIFNIIGTYVFGFIALAIGFIVVGVFCWAIDWVFCIGTFDDLKNIEK